MSNFIGGYPQITEVNGEDLLPVIQDGELKNATRNNILGYSSLVLTATQDGTDPLVSNILQNTTGETIPVWVRNASPIYYTIDLSGISGTIYINGLETSFDDNTAFSKDIYDNTGTFQGRVVISLVGTTLFFSCSNSTNTLDDFSDIAGSDTIIYFPEIRFYPA